MNDIEARVEACERALLEAVREAGHWISGDQRVTEACAAWLLGLEAATMANKRADGSGPAHYRTGRITYRLDDLARWIEHSRCEWPD